MQNFVKQMHATKIMYMVKWIIFNQKVLKGNFALKGKFNWSK
jgi:hypothetical protein